MAGYYTLGEKKVRPGTYFNRQKVGKSATSGAIDGVVAVLFRASFGPLCSAVQISRGEDYRTYFGEGHTTDAIQRAFDGGASTVIAIRVGTGGTAGSVTLKAGTADVKLTAKYPGAYDLSVTVRTKLTDETMKEVIIYHGTAILEKYEFPVNKTDDVTALKEALAGSKNFAVTGTGTGSLAAVSQAKFEGGEDPTVANSEYSTALSEAEKYYFNTICIDTEEAGVQALLANFLNRIFDAGQFGIACIAEKHTVALEDREAHAKGFNKENVIYLCNAYVDTIDGAIDGYQTAAILAGLVAATPSSQSVTHTTLPGVTEILEPLTNSQIITAEKSGCVVLSTNSDDQVWLDNAITTLINPPADCDDGWKKIRRTRTRYELLYRANTATERLKVDNDTNGQATIISTIQSVGSAMVGEGKLNGITVELDPANPADADYAYFNIGVVDKDSADYIYLNYKFQFNTNVA